jgi:hypothetical protein
MSNVRISMIIHRTKYVEVLPKIPRQECEGQEKNGHSGQLLHALVLESSHLIEEQVDHVVCGLTHGIQVTDNHDAVIFHVAKVRYGLSGDGDV